MQVGTDDIFFDTDNTYLGPPGHTLPWQARYSAYAVFALILAATALFEYRAGLTSLTLVPYTLIGVVMATRRSMKLVTFDRPASVVVSIFFHELQGTRLRKKGTTTTFRPPRLASISSRKANL